MSKTCRSALLVALALLVAVTGSASETGELTIPETGSFGTGSFGDGVSELERLRLDLDAASTRYRLEADFPSYLPSELLQPNKWFAGRDVRLVANDPKSAGIAVASLRLERREQKSLQLLDSRALVAETSQNGLSFELPLDAQSGFYVLRFEARGESISLPLEIYALDLPPASSTEGGSEIVSMTSASPDAVVSRIQRLGCDGCYWESVLWVHPDDERFGYLAGGGAEDYLLQTTDAWETHLSSETDLLSVPLLGNNAGDPKFEMTADGRLALTSLFIVPEPVVAGTGGIYLDRGRMNVPPDLEQTILRPLPPVLPTGLFLIFDFPKIAIDKDPESEYFNSIYVVANSVLFEDDTTGAGFYIVRDGVVVEKKGRDIGFRQPAQSAEVGPGGAIYHARSDFQGKQFFRSTDGGNSFTKSFFAETGDGPFCILARTSTESSQSWVLNWRPKLSVNQITGRVHVAWAQHRDCVEDPDAEFTIYATDYDIFAAYSDDQGASWSTPVRVNDDSTGGDQGFADIAVDPDGSVYVAFLDHRERQDQAVYDVYFAVSTDGGASFSRNVKINDLPVPNAQGGRNPGDYLDMIGVGETKVFVAHPCVGDAGVPEIRPTDACISVLPKPIVISSPPEPCTPDAETACLLGGKFRVEGRMDSFDDPPASFATQVMQFVGGRAESDQAVFFESFAAGNFEAAVKMVDGCSLPDDHPLRAYWAFFGALSNAETQLLIRDTVTDATYPWFSPAGELPRSFGDTGAFPCLEGTPAVPCIRGENTACLIGERFQVEGTMKDFEQPPQEFATRVMTFPGDGRAESDQSVFFDSFQRGNFEAGVKMVDACSLPDDHPLRAYWVFYGALSNAETLIEVTQVATGLVDRWSNPAGDFPISGSRLDAFTCDD